MLFRLRIPRTLLLGACGALLQTAGVAPASAHGRFPNAGLVVRHPSDAQQLVVRSTYGLVHTKDGGGRWLWSCAEAVGWNSDTEDPVLLLTSDRMVVGSFKGLSVSSPDGCNWDFLGGDGEGKFFRDIVMVDPMHVFTVASNGLGDDQFAVQVWESSDAGDSWSKYGVGPADDFLAVGISSSSDGSRLYLSGRDGNSTDGYAGVLQRSDDGGQSWQRIGVPGTENTKLVTYLAGIHPQDPDIVYLSNIEVLGVEVVSYELLLTEDGGTSFTSLFQREHGVAGFALSPDGSQFALGSPEDGLYLGNTDDHQLSQVNTLGVSCLTWHDEGLYACANEFVDGFAVGLSKDDGATFEPLMHLSSPCGVIECAEASDVGTQCPARWLIELEELGAGMCETPEPAPSSCSCKLVGKPTTPPAPWWLALVGLVAASLRRRRATAAH